MSLPPERCALFGSVRAAEFGPQAGQDGPHPARRTRPPARPCYRLPRDLEHEGVSQVLDILAARAVRFREKHGRMPCLFIDGVDLLSKENPGAFVALVDKAKALASNGSLRLVLVAGDGGALSLIEQTPSVSKQDVPVLVGDISDDEAESYLIRSGLSAPLTKRIIQLTGGRFAHLEKALWVCNAASSHDDAALYSAVRQSLYSSAERTLLRGAGTHLARVRAEGGIEVCPDRTPRRYEGGRTYGAALSKVVLRKCGGGHWRTGETLRAEVWGPERASSPQQAG